MANNIDRELLEQITGTVIENFQENEAKINDMNVFPVPVGDTGTNMLLTLKSSRISLNQQPFSLSSTHQSEGRFVGFSR